MQPLISPASTVGDKSPTHETAPAASVESRSLWRAAPSRRWLAVFTAIIILGGWYAATRDDQNAAFLFASPQAVGEELLKMISNGTLVRHVGVTVLEIMLGFGGGVICAFGLGYGIARSRLLEGLLGPYVVGFQAVPMIAIAPILIRFFGPGIPTNAVICGLIVFFPMLVSTMVGMRSIDPDLHALMRSLTATRWQLFTKLEFPGALPVLFGGLKVSATLAVVGAVVGEAFASQAGLGFLIYSSRYVYNAAGVLVAVFTLTLLALGLYEIVARIERRALAWRLNR
ncbi:Riboflavin transport system permease protein RibX [Anaerolineae bacterium]|nr:Riboflavin transport system permease protein RibX [Anaerolineae bacterium]